MGRPNGCPGIDYAPYAFAEMIPWFRGRYMIGFMRMIKKQCFPITVIGVAIVSMLLLAPPSVHAAEKAKHGGEEGGKEKGGTGFISLDPIIVNLASDKGRRLLKVTIQLEPAGPTTGEEVTNHMAQLQDTLITILSSKTWEELLTVEGKLTLKEQILTRINNVLNNGVKNVFFVEFIIQ